MAHIFLYTRRILASISETELQKLLKILMMAYKKWEKLEDK
jgi:hypothetical protein